MRYSIFGDTMFIGIVNSDKYKSFVEEICSFKKLREHFIEETNEGNLLIFQMSKKDMDYEWNIEVTINSEIKEQEYYKKSEGYITVTDGKLYLTEYDSLKIAAELEKEKIPNERYLDSIMNIENGIYKVDIIQFYDSDKDEYIGNNERDMLLNFTKVLEFNQSANDIIWHDYYLMKSKDVDSAEKTSGICVGITLISFVIVIIFGKSWFIMYDLHMKALSEIIIAFSTIIGLISGIIGVAKGSKKLITFLAIVINIIILVAYFLGVKK